jgi:hypothetical protein
MLGSFYFSPPHRPIRPIARARVCGGRARTDCRRRQAAAGGLPRPPPLKHDAHGADAVTKAVTFYSPQRPLAAAR